MHTTGATLQNVVINNGELVSSNNYAVNTLTPTINIDAIATDNVLDFVEDNHSLLVTGTTTNVSDGQVVTVTIAGVEYTSSVTGNVWGVEVPQAVAAALSSSVTVAVSVSNASGVNATANTTFTHTTDEPVVITISDNDIDSSETAVVTFRFKEAVTDFELADINVDSGTLSNLVSTDGGTTFTATFTPTPGVKSDVSKISIGSNWTYQSSGASPVVSDIKVAFENEVGVDVTTNNIVKTGFDGWTSGAFSENSLAGDGYVATTVAETNTQRMIGLSDSDTNVNFTRLITRLSDGNGALEVYENGISKGAFGSYATGDVLSVQRTGSTITYLKNGSVFYTSTVASTGDLHVDTSLIRQAVH